MFERKLFCGVRDWPAPRCWCRCNAEEGPPAPYTERVTLQETAATRIQRR